MTFGFKRDYVVYFGRSAVSFHEELQNLSIIFRPVFVFFIFFPCLCTKIFFYSPVCQSRSSCLFIAFIKRFFISSDYNWGIISPCCVVANIFNCKIVRSEFELKLHYYLHFWTNALWERHEPPYCSPTYGGGVK